MKSSKSDRWEDNLFNDYVLFGDYARQTFREHLKGEIERKKDLLERVEEYEEELKKTKKLKELPELKGAL